MRILGISCFYHDAAAVLISDSEILAAAQEERFSRVKGDESFPEKSIEFCLTSTGTRIEDLDAVVFYEKPLLTFERILENFLYTNPKGVLPFLAAMNTWLGKKLNMRSTLKKEFKRAFGHPLKKEKIVFSGHHLSHAASAFFPSPFEKAAILCMDGVGEWATTSAWTGGGNQIRPLWEIHYPHSISLLYSTFTYYCGFKINSGEYKLMGLAPFGKPRFRDLILEKLVELKDDGSFALNLRYFGFLDSPEATNARFHDLFGFPPRKSEGPMTDFYMDVAASIQDVTNEIVLRLVKKIKADTNCESLCLAGGVALNCVTNGLISESQLFKKTWIQPASGDAGGALGAALAYRHLGSGQKRILNPQDSMKGAYLGPSYSEKEFRETLQHEGLSFTEMSEGEMISWTADQLAQDQIIGWFQGPMEYGPRALGSRSILGNPLNPEMKSKMNLKIKFREGFRPFAPIVTQEAYAHYFSLPEQNEYMLLVSQVRDKSLMPSITHCDGSARVQTVESTKNPVLHQLLNEFAQRTGHPVLINTSFNVRGEPIVCTPKNAIDCFINTDLDALVLGNLILTKKQNPQLKSHKDWHAQFKLD